MRSRTARVMTTLMRNGRDRRSENPFWAIARLERVVVFGTDQRITSGPAATVAASRWRQAFTRKQAAYMAAPERFAKRQIPLAPRAPSIHGPSTDMPIAVSESLLWREEQKWRGLATMSLFDPSPRLVRRHNLPGTKGKPEAPTRTAHDPEFPESAPLTPLFQRCWRSAAMPDVSYSDVSVDLG